MIISSGTSYTFRVGSNSAGNGQQRKVEALAPPALEPPVESKNIDPKSIQSSDEKARSEGSSKELTKNGDANENKNKTVLTSEENVKVEVLAKRDREVRAHEAAHLSAAGDLAQSGANFEYTKGPDGRQYATGGEVSIDSTKANTPEETMIKAQRIRAAALAPAVPSAQDQRVSAQASQLVVEARSESQQQKIEESKQADDEQNVAGEELQASNQADSTSRVEAGVDTNKLSAAKNTVSNSGNISPQQTQYSDTSNQQILAVNNRASEYTALDSDSGAGRIFNLVT